VAEAGATRRRLRWPLPAALVCGLLTTTVGGVTGAAASSLGGVSSAGMAGFSFASSSGAPTVIAYENFTGSNGTAISGTTTDGGGFTWNANLGTWTVQGNQARSTSASDGNILFNGTSSNGSVEAKISRNGNNSWDTYVIFNSDSTFSNCLLADWWHNASGSIDLYKGVAGSFVQIASVNGLYPSTIPASAVIRLESPSTSIIKIYLDGVLKLTYTLSAAEQTALKNSTHRYAGFGANSDAISTFDNFHVDA
jgi:hypothetical protein